MKICTLKYRGAFALAAKIAGLLPYGAFALQPRSVYRQPWNSWFAQQRLISRYTFKLLFSLILHLINEYVSLNFVFILIYKTMPKKW